MTVCLNRTLNWRLKFVQETSRKVLPTPVKKKIESLRNLKILIENYSWENFSTFLPNMISKHITGKDIIWVWTFQCTLTIITIGTKLLLCLRDTAESHKGFFKRNALSSIFWNYLKTEFSSVLKPHQTNVFFHILSYFFEHVDRGCFLFFFICFWVQTSAKRNHLYVVIFARAANHVKTTKVSWML